MLRLLVLCLSIVCMLFSTSWADMITDSSYSKLLPSHYNPDDYDFKYVDTKDGVKEFVSDSPNSKQRTFRAEMIINQPIEVLMAVMLDAENFPEWLPGCNHVDHLKTYGGDRFRGHYLLQVIWNSPWPIPDYDFIVESLANHYWDKDYITVELFSRDDTDIPSPKGTMRLKKFYSRYKLTIIDRETTHVSYLTMSDPGARFTPRWLIESSTKKIPYKTLKALEKRAQHPIFMERAARDLM